MPNWREVLEEVSTCQQRAKSDSAGAFDTVRRKYLKLLHEHSGRNIIAYYSGFLSKPDIDSEINDEDKNAFMMAVHQLDRSKGLDLILHTPGGGIAATQSIVNYLHKMFGRDIRAIVPQIAMSAGTLIACSCKSIMMSKHSNLGPIDPQIGGMPAYGVIKEFKRACREVKKDPSRIPIWQVILSKYPPTFIDRCRHAIAWSNSFAEEQLRGVMFGGEEDASQKAHRAVRALSSYTGNKTHDRHLHAEDCIQVGLKIESIEEDPDFQDLLLTVHHSFMHALTNTAAFKLIENHLGAAFVKQASIAVSKA